MKAWFFSNTDCRLRYDDNRLIEAGITHKVDCPLVLCESGLHGSKNILDALKYAPGPYVWRVELLGDIVHGDDKSVASERHYLWGYDATDVLRKVARLCALDVIHLWDAPDVVVRYLKTGDESLQAAAQSAAGLAAWSAQTAAWSAWSAARSTAASIARSIAESAWSTWSAARSAQSAARSTAWSTARSAHSAAQSAAGAAQTAAWSTAESTAESTAWSAAKEKQSRHLYRMIMENKPS